MHSTVLGERLTSMDFIHARKHNDFTKVHLTLKLMYNMVAFFEWRFTLSKCPSPLFVAPFIKVADLFYETVIIECHGIVETKAKLCSLGLSIYLILTPSFSDRFLFLFPFFHQLRFNSILLDSTYEKCPLSATKWKISLRNFVEARVKNLSFCLFSMIQHKITSIES